MRRNYHIFGFILSVWLLCTVSPSTAQVRDLQLGKTLLSLTSKGWLVQHESLSYDKQTIYFSACEPGSKDYNLYTCTRTRNGWSAPQVLSSQINTADAELWPSISADEQLLFFVREYPDPNSKKHVLRRDIFLANRGADGWENAQMLVISDGASISPLLMPDGMTLFYASSQQGSDNKHNRYKIYYTRRAGKYNWFLPKLVDGASEDGVHLYGPAVTSSEPGELNLQVTQQIIARRDTSYMLSSVSVPESMRPAPVLHVSGAVTDAVTKRPLAATLVVTDAISQTTLSTHTTNFMGQYALALAHGRVYNIDIYGEGYSHRYLDYDCTSLQRDTTITEPISLSGALSLSIYLFDAETNKPLTADKPRLAKGVARMEDGRLTLQLPINEQYNIDLTSKGYESSTLSLDTRKDVLLPSSELDVLFRPGKAPLTITLTDEETAAPLTAEILLSNLSHEEVLNYTSPSLPVRQGDTYRLQINSVGYFFVDTTILVPPSANPIALNMALRPIRAGKVMQLRNIQFELASSDLTEDSYEELNHVVRLLRDNPNLKIELSAHTDDQGSDSFNNLLSQRRGETARRYLIRHGISPSRIVSVGYGKSRPLMPNDSEENRAINRRVEFKVTEI